MSTKQLAGAENPVQDLFATIGKIVGGSLAGLFGTVIVYMIYKKTQEKDTSIQSPMAYEIYKQLQLSLRHIAPKADPHKRECYVSTITHLTGEVETKLAIRFRDLYRSPKPEDQTQFAHYVELFSDSIQKHVEMHPSQLCGIRLICCLKSYELLESDLTNSSKRQQIINEVISAEAKGEPIIKKKSCCPSFAGIFSKARPRSTAFPLESKQIASTEELTSQSATIEVVTLNSDSSPSPTEGATPLVESRSISISHA
ncbi:MAG: hypothetical protein JSR33_04680 [Proteobacteria bacterium]|nr:hypothetical protein [Pseudomonadota bacterium]